MYNSSNDSPNIGCSSTRTNYYNIKNNYVDFCNIAEKLVDKLPLRTYREDRVEGYHYNKEKGIERNYFKFNVVEQLEVENMVRYLDISKSAGVDKISSIFLRDAAEVIASHLTYIMNLSLKSATVPDDFKLARVLPIYKKGNRNDEGNYRPVSILPVASTVLEQISVYYQMHNYLEQNNPIYTLRTMYNSLILPHLNFSILSWGLHSGRLPKLQKRAARIITLNKYNAHTEPILKSLGLLKVNDIFTLQCLKVYYKYTHGRVPTSFALFFTRNTIIIQDKDTNPKYFLVILREQENVLNVIYHYCLEVCQLVL